MKVTLSILIMTCSLFAASQEKSALEFQLEINEQYRTKDKSPLPDEKIDDFEGLPFFPINSSYIVKAKLIRNLRNETLQMKTSTNRLPTYIIYGTLSFIIKGQEFTLHVYQSEMDLGDEYVNYLFLPFTDATNGDETYGGGRYVDLTIPETDEITIDFNQAYNPYCAYNNRYSCPIPPEGNDIPIKVLAGVKFSH